MVVVSLLHANLTTLFLPRVKSLELSVALRWMKLVTRTLHLAIPMTFDHRVVKERVARLLHRVGIRSALRQWFATTICHLLMVQFLTDLYAQFGLRYGRFTDMIVFNLVMSIH